MPVETIAGWAITDHEHSLRDDLAKLRSSRHLPPDLPVSGVRFDEASGLAEVLFTDGEA